MKSSKLVLTIVFNLCLLTYSSAQIEEKGTPLGFQLDLGETERFEVPLINNATQRVATEELPIIPIGEIFHVGARPEKDGKWFDLSDGSRIWQLELDLPGAIATNLYFKDFYLPEGAKMFIYNKEKNQVLGAYTSANNKTSGIFATRLLAGSTAIIEYFEPADVAGKGHFEISEASFVHKGDGISSPLPGEANTLSAGSCNVNTACEEAELYNPILPSVVRILIRIGDLIGWCSGVLLNNTNNDFTPYVLTAQHCGLNTFSGFLTSESDIAQWVFYFNYDAPVCTGAFSTSDIELQSITGATTIAESDDEGGETGSDFLLLELNEGIPESYQPVFAGWDRTETAYSQGVSIHHPDGDVKKVSTFRQTITPSQFNANRVQNTHWRVLWSATTNGHGITEGGSSGAPLFNEDALVIGTLSGGNSSCSSLDSPDIFGKFSYHWNQNGTEDNRSLQRWLDPKNTGRKKLRSIDLNYEETEVDFIVYPNPNSGTFNIQADVVGTINIKLYDTMGKLIYSESGADFEAQEIEVLLRRSVAGLYILTLEGENLIETKKIIIQ